MFIDHNYIYSLLTQAEADLKRADMEKEIKGILSKARQAKGLEPLEVAKLLQVEDQELVAEIFQAAGEVKRSIYGNRVVLFAPLYISDHCVNNCVYCGYRRDNRFARKRLSMAEIEEEVRLLTKAGHKRIALELGEDPAHAGIDYTLEAIDTIYQTQSEYGNIRRINVNIAATSVDNYRLLKQKNIGTYILFQETYHQPTYERMHPQSIKGDYLYHLTAFDRAMEAGIDDVGGGVLFGLYDYKFEALGLLLHNNYLEQQFGVGFHTISFPRIRQAEGIDLETFPHLVDDSAFKKIIAVMRLAVPYTGIILSTRETPEMRRELLNYGVSQISAGSSTGVGGYKLRESGESPDQFNIEDHRSPLEIIKELVRAGFIPSYCTACYRQGRSGDRFMELAKTGAIQNVCAPNALLTFMEYILDYGDAELYQLGKEFIRQEVAKLPQPETREFVFAKLGELEQGQRDLFI